MLKIGIVGCGNAGKSHIKAYLKTPNISVVGVYDIDPKRTEIFQNEFNTKSMTLKELISEADVVDITVPTCAHMELVEMAAVKGKNIICETPLARTIEDVDRIAEICRANNVRLIPVHVSDAAGPYASLKNKLEKGQLSKVGMIRISRKNDGIPESARNWRRDFNLSGGVVLDWLIQDITFLIKNIGQVVRVSSHNTSSNKDFKGEYALISLRFKNGTIAHLDGSWIDNVRGQDELEFAYKGGLVSYSKQLSAPLFISTDKGSCTKSPMNNDVYDIGLAEIAGALQSEREARVTLEESREALRVALAAAESANTGEVVILDEQGVAL